MIESLRNQRIYVIGIGGTGMSPIALVLNEMGVQISGSDRAASDFTKRLAARGVVIYTVQDAANLGNADLVIYSSAVHEDNPELAEAHRRGIPTEKRRDFLRTLLKDRDTAAIAGTHGKTTTTSMTAWAMQSAGVEPGFIIGSVSKDLETNAAAGQGRAFVIEADEYDRMFLGIDPYVAALTRVEYDHPDCYPTHADYFEAFRDFLGNTRPDGVILLNAGDPNQEQFRNMKNARICTYGMQSDADFQARDAAVLRHGCWGFTFVGDGQKVPVVLAIPGRHNVDNALTAMSICSLYKLDLNKAAAALNAFSGIARRFEKIAEWNDIIVIDDYAHHPTEIRATLAAARDYFPNRRIWALWQPHTYSRTKELLSEFCASFADADELMVTNIFAAREKQTDFGIDDLKKALHHSSLFFATSVEDAAAQLVENLKPGDVLITLSAGDANLAGPMALERMKHARA